MKKNPRRSIEVSWIISNNKIQDVYFASIEEFCAIHENDPRVPYLFIYWLPTLFESFF